jgi:hypothetical protein
VALLPALPVGAPVAGLSYGLYRLSYRGALQGTEKEIRTMLAAVGGAVRAQEVFGQRPGAVAERQGGRTAQRDTDPPLIA